MATHPCHRCGFLIDTAFDRGWLHDQVRDWFFCARCRAAYEDEYQRWVDNEARPLQAGRT